MSVPVATYGLLDYGAMVNDAARMRAFERALAAAVRPGDVVLDVGAGPGIFALLACRLGASHVHAIDPDASLLLGAELAEANGWSDRITFHRKLSWDVKLPQRANVVVSDLRGVLPLFGTHLSAIIDVRDRLLVPGGTLIPGRDVVMAALVDNEELHGTFARPWSTNELALDLRRGHAYASNLWQRARLEPAHLASEPCPWATFDYRTVDSPNAAGTVEWVMQQQRTVHGVALWFDTDLGGGAQFSNAPGSDVRTYRQAFFPWPQATPLAPGDVACVGISATLVDDDYMWAWNSQVRDAAGAVRAHWKQSTFHGTPLSATAVRQRGEGFVPQPSQHLLANADALALVDGQRSLGDIARELMRRHPGEFPSWRDALTRAADLLEGH